MTGGLRYEVRHESPYRSDAMLKGREGERSHRRIIPITFGSIEAPADERVGKPRGAAYNWEQKEEEAGSEEVGAHLPSESGGRI